MNSIKAKLKKFAKERNWEQYHSPKNLSMALSVEAAELMEIFQWVTEEESKTLNGKKKQAIEEELADILNYLIKIADHYDIDLVKAANKKISKNAKKYPAKKVKSVNEEI